MVALQKQGWRPMAQCISFATSLLAFHSIFQQFKLKQLFCVTGPDGLAFTHQVHHWALGTHDPGTGSAAVLAQLLADKTTAYQEYPQDLLFGDALTCSHHYLALFKVTQIFSLSLFACFQHMKFKNWLFTCFLIYTSPWHVPL